MGLLGNELQSEIEERKKLPKPRLQEIADQLSGDDRKDFLEALNDKTISSYSLSLVLKRRGFSVSQSLITVYRRGGLSYEVS